MIEFVSDFFPNTGTNLYKDFISEFKYIGFSPDRVIELVEYIEQIVKYNCLIYDISFNKDLVLLIINWFTTYYNGDALNEFHEKYFIPLIFFDAFICSIRNFYFLNNCVFSYCETKHIKDPYDDCMYTMPLINISKITEFKLLSFKNSCFKYNVNDYYMDDILYFRNHYFITRFFRNRYFIKRFFIDCESFKGKCKFIHSKNVIKLKNEHLKKINEKKKHLKLKIDNYNTVLKSQIYNCEKEYRTCVDGFKESVYIRDLLQKQIMFIIASTCFKYNYRYNDCYINKNSKFYNMFSDLFN